MTTDNKYGFLKLKRNRFETFDTEAEAREAAAKLESSGRNERVRIGKGRSWNVRWTEA